MQPLLQHKSENFRYPFANFYKAVYEPNYYLSIASDTTIE